MGGWQVWEVGIIGFFGITAIHIFINENKKK